jgi:uncharacterized protein (TIGR03435 family)
MHLQEISTRKLLIRAVAGLMAVAAPCLLGQQSALLLAQAATVQAPTEQTQKIPEWEAAARGAAAGGKLEFEVASVREDLSGKFHPWPFSMDTDDGYPNAGGLFTADLSLGEYIAFAYKLPQQYNMIAHLPDWAKSKHFEITARPPAGTTKDQLRLMMQALLAERFKLALHYETQETEALVMTLAKPGKLGPRLRLHADGPACDVVAQRPPGATITFDMFPCNTYMAATDRPDVILAGARNTSVESMAAFFSSVGRMRPIVDRTGITGNIDFSMEYKPAARGAAAPGADAQAELPGTTFEQAVRDQLGLKLEPAKAPLDIPVVDHVEMPSEN